MEDTGNSVAVPEKEELQECYYCGHQDTTHYLTYCDELKRWYCADCEYEYKIDFIEKDWES